MPKKSLTESHIHPKVSDRILLWGQVLAAVRRKQRLSLNDMAQRVQVSQQTLVRMEKGDVTVRIATWMTVFQVLGVLDYLAPLPPAELLDRALLPQRVRKPEVDDDF